MQRVFLILLLGWTMLSGSNAVWAQSAAGEMPQVQLVLFYSPTCPHCHKVINEDLPPLQEQYGDQLQILGVDVSQAAGGQLYQDAITALNITEDRLGVPTLIIGDVILVGSLEIPQQLPSLIAAGIEAGGIGWPAIPSLTVIVPNLPPSADPEASVAAVPTDPVPTVSPSPPATKEAVIPVVEPSPEPTVAPEPTTAVAASEPSVETGGADLADEPTVVLDDLSAAQLTFDGATPAPDPVGFTLAWVILVGMVVALAYVLMRMRIARSFFQPSVLVQRLTPLRSRLVPALLLIGFVVAAYLAYVEMRQVLAVCGPVGECNIVQASPYARLFGIPVAVLGLINYVSLAGLWIWQMREQNPTAVYGLLLLTIVGTLFSIYLTALELFAIHAVCIWCLTSAVVTTMLMLVVVSALTRQQQRDVSVTLQAP